MTEASTSEDQGWRTVLQRFEQHSPASAMVRAALEQALPADGIGEVFDAHRRDRYARELLFSTIVESMTLVALGLRPSLHAAARQMENLPVSLTALHNKINRTEPEILEALVRGSAERLAPAMAGLGQGAILPGWTVRVLDGNHFPGTEKRIASPRGHGGAALPGQALVVYDPDSGLVLDRVGGEDAYESERTLAGRLIESAGPGQVWIADRHFRTRPLLEGFAEAGACFIVREYANHPRLAQRGAWQDRGRVETGTVREQAITLEGHATPWRCVELVLDVPTESDDTTIRLWSNLPSDVDARQIADAYRKRWSIEGMFGRLESVPHSEIATLGQPRAAPLGFAVSVLAYNVLSLIARRIERAHEPTPEVSFFHLTAQIRSGYEGMTIALPPGHWSTPAIETSGFIEYLMRLAQRIRPKSIALRKRAPKAKKPKRYVDGATARAHVATARVMAKAKLTR